MNQTFTPPICAVNPVVGAIKRLGRSPLFLCICIFQTIAAGLTLLSSVGMMGSPLMDFEGMELVADSSLLSFVFPALFAMGLWLIRHACKSDVSPFVTTGGLKTVKVLVTIQLVFMYIVAGCIPVFLLGMLALGSAASDIFSDPSVYGEFDEEFLDEFSGTYSFSVDEFVSTGLISILVIALVIVLAVLVYFIIYYHSLRRGVTTLMENAEGILTDRSFSMFTIVTFFIAGGCGAFSALSSLALLPLAGLASGVMATVYILGGVFMCRYRKEMEQLRFMSSHMAPAAPFVPEAQPAPQPAPAYETVPPQVQVAPVPAVDVSPVAEPVADPIPEPQPVPVACEFCSECGRKRGEGEKFCPGCGKPFSN